MKIELLLLMLLALLTLPACATARSEVAIEAVVGQGDPQVHVVAKVVIP